MAIQLIISKQVGFRVKGFLNDADGNPQPFDFSLTADRLDTEALQERTGPGVTMGEFLEGVVTDWKGIKDEHGNNLAFSKEHFNQLLKIPGLATLVYQTYFAEAGARAKN